MAAGLDADGFLKGVQSAMDDCRENPENNPAVRYGEHVIYFMKKAMILKCWYRLNHNMNILQNGGFSYLEKVKGRKRKESSLQRRFIQRIFNSIGQYMQDGRRNLIETFVSVQNPKATVVIEPIGVW